MITLIMSLFPEHLFLNLAGVLQDPLLDSTLG